MNLRKEAKGRDCQVRLPGVCNFDNRTVVLAHKNGAGIAMKHNDFIGAWACSSCHDVIDGRKTSELSKEIITLWFYDGIFRTQEVLIKEGKIKHD